MLVALLVAALVAGCGGADQDSAPAPQPELSGKPADFPKVRGGTLQDIQAEKGSSLVFRPTVKDLRRGLQGPVAAWRLQTEPWTYVISRSGRIAARFEGAFSAGELQRAVANVARSG